MGVVHRPQDPAPEGIRLAEAAQIRQALLQTGGNVVHAARLLGVSRDTVRYRMQRYGIERPRLGVPSPAMSPLPPGANDRGSSPQGEGRPPGLAVPQPPPRAREEEQHPQGSAAPLDAEHAAAIAPHIPSPVPAWEHTPVAVLALALTWPEISALESLRYDPWTEQARWEQSIVDKVGGFGGTLVQRTASLLVWVFGVPHVLEQLPQRAVHGALAIRRMVVDASAPDLPPCPEIHLAVHLGAVRVDHLAADSTAQVQAAGETLALPVRLLGQAEPGALVVSPEVGRFVDGWVTLEEWPLPLGAGNPARVGGYAVVGVSPGREVKAGHRRPIRSPLVGRERELLLLDALLEQVQAGRGQVVSLVGAPGMGKSRLLDEFRQRLSGQRISYAAGQCLAYGSETPYLSVLDLPRDHCGIATNDPPEVHVTKLRVSLQQARFDPDASLPYLLDLLGLPVGAEQLSRLSAEARKARTFEIVRQLFLISSQYQPLVLPMENLHWIDPTSEALLQAIAELPAAALQRGLVHLQAAEFLYETHLFPEHAYTFKHELTHEVAYSSLPQARRRDLHARIVEALDASAGQRGVEPVEQLAHHALRGEVWDKALAYCRQAGEKAAARSAHREATASFEQALSALPHLPEARGTHEQAIDLRLHLCDALWPLGEIERSLDVLHPAETLAETLGDRPRPGRVLASMTRAFFTMNQLDRGLASGTRALTIGMALDDFPLQVLANFYLGQIHYGLGHYRQAMDVLRWNVAFLQGDLLQEHFGAASPLSAFSRGRLVWCLAEVGEFAEGIVRGAEAIRIAEASHHRYGHVAAHFSMGVLSARKGEIHNAISMFERCLTLYQILNLPIWFPVIASALAYVYALSGRVAEATPYLDQVMERTASMRVITFHSFQIICLSVACMLVGRMAEATDLAERVLDLCRQRKERGYEAWTLRLLGEVAARREPPEAEQAKAYYRQAFVLDGELGMRPLKAHCHRGLGTLYRVTGQQAQSHTELLAAVTLYRALEMTFWLPQTGSPGNPVVSREVW